MNPYEVLGVSPNASQEEIRAAYLKLVKKYHPDRYQDSALKKQAEEKMKQINAAYDMLKNGSAQSGDRSGTSYSGAGRSSYSGDYASEFARVRNFLNNGAVDAAMAVLNSIPLRNAEWNFLYGMCCYRKGQFAAAYEYVSRAVNMDPDNFEYRSALVSMRGQQSGSSFDTATIFNSRSCSLCGSLLCANLCCGAFRRGYWCR